MHGEGSLHLSLEKAPRSRPPSAESDVDMASTWRLANVLLVCFFSIRRGDAYMENLSLPWKICVVSEVANMAPGYNELSNAMLYGDGVLWHLASLDIRWKPDPPSPVSFPVSFSSP